MSFLRVRCFMFSGGHDSLWRLGARETSLLPFSQERLYFNPGKNFFGLGTDLALVNTDFVVRCYIMYVPVLLINQS